MKIALSGNWKGFEGIMDQAEAGDVEYVELQVSIERSVWHRVGRVRKLMLELDTVAALRALVKEAQYQNDYWNNPADPYGVRDGGSFDASSARAAKSAFRRAEALLAEATS